MLGDTAHVLRVKQHALDHRQEFLARFGQSEQALAAPDEDLDPELVLEILDVLGNARL